MIVKLSHSVASSLRMWELMKMVFPIRESVRKISISSILARGSRPLAGSSRRRSSGSWTRTRARLSRCCMPRERPLIRSVRRPSMSVSDSVSSTVFLRSARVRPYAAAKKSRYSSTVIWR